MTPAAVVHVGIEKTGTTSIQRALAANRPTLREFALLYPETIDGRLGHHELADAVRLKAGERGPEIAYHYRNQLDQAAQTGSTLLLSSEYFHAALHPELLGRLASILPGDLRFVLYAERQDRHIERKYGQLVRVGEVDGGRFSGSIELFLARYSFVNLLDYRKHVRAIESVFGGGAVSVRIYDRSRFVGGDVVRDFLDHLTVDSAQMHLDDRETNPSLSNPALELVRRMNEVGLGGDERKHLLARIRTVDTQGWSRANLLRPDMRHALLAHFADSNRLLFESLNEPNLWLPDCAWDEPDPAGDDNEFDRFLMALLATPHRL